MALIGELAVNLLAKTLGFDSKIDKSRKATKRLESAGLALDKRLRALAAGFGAVQLGRFAANQFSVLDATAKTSRTIGIQVEELLALRLAARQTGVEETALENSLKILNRRLGEAKIGIGEGKRALDDLGLSSVRLANIPLNQSFGEIADALNKQSTQADKARIINGLLGRSGADLINTLAIGSSGLDKFRSKIVGFGGALSSDGISKVEEFNDQLDILKTQLGVKVANLTITVAPAALSVLEGITRFARSFDRGIGTFGLGFGEANFRNQIFEQTERNEAARSFRNRRRAENARRANQGLPPLFGRNNLPEVPTGAATPTDLF